MTRLAEALGVGTDEVLDRYVGEDGATLKTTRHGACIFLEGRDCSVHGGRPLVCRTYPLGRVLSRDDGEEVIVELRPHPQSEGVYRRGDARGGGGTAETVRRATVADYFEAQGVRPYERAGRRYRAILERLARLLASETTVAENVPPLMDVDAAVSVDCEARGVPVPDGVEQRIRLHLALLDHWLARHEEADGPPGPSLIVPARRTNTATPT